MHARLEPEMAPVSIGVTIKYAAQTPGTWAGGTTSAIYAYPPEAIGTPASARLWVGTAVIERASAYSYFPGRVRVHVPIQGNGIRLHFQNPAELVSLNTFAQYRFDGARPVQAELVDRAIVAFNLIAQNDVAAQVQVLQIDGDVVTPELDLERIPAHAQLAGPASVVQIVYVVNGAVEIKIAGQPPIILHGADAFVLHPRAAAAPLGAQLRLRGLAGMADLVIATLVYDARSER